MNNITKMPRHHGKRLVLRIFCTVVFALIYFYLQLPALNFKNPGVYFYILMIIAFFAFISNALTKPKTAYSFVGQQMPYELNIDIRKLKLWIIAAALPLAILIIGGVISSPIFFHADEYSQLISTQTGDFASEIDEISYDQIPMLDETSANTLANRKLGELSDLVSQFTVNNESFQINYQGRPVRVTYLNYGSFFKWMNNVSAGIPAYIIVDMVTQEVTVVRLEDGIIYSPSEYFFRNVNRHLRFNYPTLMFADVNLEIDENGNPWWVASVVDKTIGLFGGEDCIGAVLLNATTGESVYCHIEDVPTWVDRVFTADLIIQQYNYYGSYHNGFWNSVLAQSGCVMATDGSNYIAMNDDVWVYTGVTSVSSDESNIGFILVNQRTKDARFYPIAGAEEYSAASSAQGAVQQYEYRATFPLLLNISGQPTYFMALKDESSLVKMYAMVNVQQYQIVATGNSVAECETKYINLLKQNNISVSENSVTEDPELQITGIIAEIKYAVIDGYTKAYIRLDGKTVFYTISSQDSELIAVLEPGDKVIITAAKSSEELCPALNIARAK